MAFWLGDEQVNEPEKVWLMLLKVTWLCRQSEYRDSILVCCRPSSQNPCLCLLGMRSSLRLGGCEKRLASQCLWVSLSSIHCRLLMIRWTGLSWELYVTTSGVLWLFCLDLSCSRLSLHIILALLICFLTTSGEYCNSKKSVVDTAGENLCLRDQNRCNCST